MRKFSSLSLTSRVIIIVALVLVVCLVLFVGIRFSGIVMLFSRHYESSFVISSSPDDQYELSVREWSCLGGGGADVYIRGTEWYNSWSNKKIGTAIGDNGYQPFSNETYYVEWESETVTIYYYESLPVENVNDCSTWRGVVSYEFE